MALEFETGSLVAAAYLPTPAVPTIVAEWAALVPLACHLASPRDDYLTTGEASLMGYLSVPLFPRLGTLAGMARLLRRGSKYLDYASTRGGSSRTVWDVRWGSRFPSANGAASVAISDYILRRYGEDVRPLPPSKTTVAEMPNLPKGNGVKSPGMSNAEVAQVELLSRRQILHVYRFRFTTRRRTLRHCIGQAMTTKLAAAATFVVLSGFAVILGLVGAYGSAATIINTAVSQLVTRAIVMYRPSGYLKNNEQDDTACMLVAAHDNATEWHFYIGDRSIVDTLLNKPMIMIPEGNRAQLAARWFEVAHLFQLITITYVAAERGWDGICLLLILLVHYFFQWIFRTEMLASDWLTREGVEAKARSYEFGWRTAMIGAIQVLSQSRVSRWMDSIVVPHPRRDAFLTRLRGEELEKGVAAQFSSHDFNWIENAASVSFVSAKEIRRDFDVDE